MIHTKQRDSYAWDVIRHANVQAFYIAGQTRLYKSFLFLKNFEIDLILICMYGMKILIPLVS